VVDPDAIHLARCGRLHTASQRRGGRRAADVTSTWPRSSTYCISRLYPRPDVCPRRV